MLSLREAVGLVVKNVRPLPSERISLRRAAGRILAETLRAPFDLPRFDFSSVDGFALRSEDLRGASAAHPVSLRIAATAYAGGKSRKTVQRGSCVKIMTGAEFPAGADAIVMKEDVRLHGDTALFRRPVRDGVNIRRRGGEFHRNDIVLPAGTFLSPPAVGLIASLGISSVRVTRLPRVAVITTGSELVRPGRSLRRGGIYDANTPALTAALESIGIKPSFVRTVKDDRRRLAPILRRALRDSDLVVTLGGVSVGDADLVREIAKASGVKELFWRVALKPGKPNYVGRRKSVFLFGLPGNPVSALVSFRQLVVPALRTMLGDRTGIVPPVQAHLSEAVKLSPNRLQLIRGVLRRTGSGLEAGPLRGQDSHMLGALATANCLIHIPQGEGLLRAGSFVDVTFLHWRSL